MKKILTAPPHSVAPEALLLDEEATNTIDSWQTFEDWSQKETEIKDDKGVLCSRTNLYPTNILPYTIHTSCKGCLCLHLQLNCM